MLQTFLLKEHSKGNWTLKGHPKSTLRSVQEHSRGTWALRHSRNLGTWALKHLKNSGTQKALGHLETQDTWAFSYLGARELERHLETQALRYLSTWVLDALEPLYLADWWAVKSDKFCWRSRAKTTVVKSMK